MKTLYIDCSMGAAGDMLTAALLELLPDPEAFLERLNGLGIPGVSYVRSEEQKNGIRGTHMCVRIRGTEEEAFHAHPEEQEHHRHHEHRSLKEILDLVDSLPVRDATRKNISEVYQLLAEAESTVHGSQVSEIHFHEVGMLDAVADITAVCLLMEELQPDVILASPVHVGSGTIKCAHGVLPVPAPATAELLKGIPIYSGEIKGELCTPTGAALLRHFVTRFENMPAIAVSRIGYGIGTKDFPTANCLRVFLGETAGDTDIMTELSLNVDDMTAEEIGFAMDRIFEAGAAEVYTVPIGMKKNRPGTLIRAICRPEKKDDVIRSIFRHTSTIGLRAYETKRYVLSRKEMTKNTPYGEVHWKHTSGYGVTKEKAEYDDVARIAMETGRSFSEIRDAIRLSAQPSEET